MKAAPIRWTISQAAVEFGVDRRTVDTRLKAAAVVPAPDGTFSTGQIAAAICGDLAGEKLRKLRAEANVAEMKDLQMRGELVFLADAKRVWVDAIVWYRKTLEEADYIPQKSRERLAKSLVKIKLAEIERCNDGEGEPTR